MIHRYNVCGCGCVSVCVYVYVYMYICANSSIYNYKFRLGVTFVGYLGWLNWRLNWDWRSFNFVRMCCTIKSIATRLSLPRGIITSAYFLVWSDSNQIKVTNFESKVILWMCSTVICVMCVVYLCWYWSKEGNTNGSEQVKEHDWEWGNLKNIRAKCTCQRQVSQISRIELRYSREFDLEIAYLFSLRESCLMYVVLCCVVLYCVCLGCGVPRRAKRVSASVSTKIF
jgi:hypothetical protein